MKKVFFLVALFIMSSAVWNSSAGAAKRSVQALTGSGVSYTYDQDAPLVTDASQFSSNSSSAGDGSSYANMIDDNPSTLFHSIWETAMGDATTTADSWAALMKANHATESVGIGYHNLQIALNSPVSSFIFKFSGRQDATWHDNPNDIDIYATNDDALAQNVDASTSTSWTKIEEFTDPTIKNEIINNYISPAILLGAPYKYIRLVIKGTTNMNFPGLARQFVVPEITGVTWNVSEFQMYEAVEVTSPLDKLKAFADSINTLGLNFTASLGSDPGFYSQANYDAYTAAKDKAEQYLGESHSDAEYAAVEAEYRAAYKAMVPNPVREGYYNIVSALSSFGTAQPNTTKAMYTEGDSLLYWGDLNTTQGRYLFHITAATDGSFAIQNVASKLYIKSLLGDADQNDTQVYLSVNPDVAQQFRFLGNGQFNIFNDELTTGYGYNAQSSNSGAGIKGTVCRWTSTANGECAWYLKEVTDQDLINTLTNSGSQEILTSALNNAIPKGETARNKANDYTALITKPSQISSNAQSPGDGSSYANLIDGNTSTIFHSVWDGTFKTVVTEGLGWHNLQFALPYAISKMKFNYTGRDDTSWADSPDHITIYGTNDDALGASTAAADSSSWSEITDLTDGFPGNVALSKYASPAIDLNGSYKYLRFVVKHTTNENKQGDRTFVVPEITGVTFNLSEMQVYDGNPAVGSEYNTVTGMKAACDALDGLITQARAKVTANTATQADVDALTAAIKAVNDLYVDRDAYYAEFTALLDSSNTLYNNAMGAKQKLITSADQFSTNSSSADDGSSFANLIDGNTETIFHSHWDTAMADPTTTADSWATLQTTWITNNTSNIAVGTGYHNLQVKLTEPVNNFYFQYTGRNSDWHDNPNDIEILATNDDALGASVLASDSTQWTKITELNETLDDAALLAYTSPQIDLVNSYKYIRFVIKNTTHRDKVDTRKCVNPFITGVTWNVSEFQMYTGLNPERVQYNYIPEMKAAVDALKKILDDDAALTKSDLTNYSIISTLRAAKNDVLSQYADSTELVSLYKRYITYADSSVVGDGIGYVKTQDAISTFRNAVIAAKAPVSLTQPTKPMLTTATNAMKNAFTTFMTNVGQIVPNQWYNILSGSDYPYAQNQPIFLVSTSTGTQLKLGNYPIDQIPPAGDPYCIWRFIPIDGKPGQYAIQNLGTGQYFGPYRGKGSANSPLMSHEKAPYEFQYYGNGRFKLIQVGVTDDYNCLKADRTDFVVLNYPADGHSQQSWKFEAIRPDQELSFNSMPDNSIQIMTLPFENKGDLSISNLNENVQTYAIKSLTVTETGSKLELTKKDNFEAGEPFIMTVNDYTKYDASKTHPVSFAVPASVIDTSTIVANGLVGTLQGMTINKPGLGVFLASKLSATVKGNTSISGRAGYINPNLVTTQEGNADLTIEVGDLLNGVKSVVINKATDKVNVYTIDGKLLKKNVKATEAQKGLNKGLYIVGKKKIAVK